MNIKWLFQKPKPPKSYPEGDPMDDILWVIFILVLPFLIGMLIGGIFLT